MREGPRGRREAGRSGLRSAAQCDRAARRQRKRGPSERRGPAAATIDVVAVPERVDSVGDRQVNSGTAGDKSAVRSRAWRTPGTPEQAHSGRHSGQNRRYRPQPGWKGRLCALRFSRNVRLITALSHPSPSSRGGACQVSSDTFLAERRVPLDIAVRVGYSRVTKEGTQVPEAKARQHESGQGRDKRGRTAPPAGSGAARGSGRLVRRQAAAQPGGWSARLVGGSGP